MNAKALNGSPADPNLAELIARWPDLHEAIKERVLAVVRPSTE